MLVLLDLLILSDYGKNSVVDTMYQYGKYFHILVVSITNLFFLYSQGGKADTLSQHREIKAFSALKKKKKDITS